MVSSSQITALFFQAPPCLTCHVYALRRDAKAYIRQLTFLCESGSFSVVSNGARARVLAALHITSQHTTIPSLLQHCEVTDIVKALTLLDRSRKARQLSGKIQRIEDDNPGLVHQNDNELSNDQDGKGKQDGGGNAGKRKRNRNRKIDSYRHQHRALVADLEEAKPCSHACIDAHEDTAVRELIQSGSVSGALARKVKDWAKISLKSDFLEHVMLALPADAWRDLADLVHFSPTDFNVPYFLSHVFSDDTQGSSVPEDSFVWCMRDLVAASHSLERSEIVHRFLCLAEDFPQLYLSYSFLRTQPSLAACPEIAEHCARNIPLDTAIWFFEELFSASKRCEPIVRERLADSADANVSAKSKVTYGKAIERILTFRRMRLRISEELISLASTRLDGLKDFFANRSQADARVAIFGDASSSMQRAIEAATIFASMASIALNGELSFFAADPVRSPHKKPGDVPQTLDVCRNIRASGCTSHAAALWPYYEAREPMDMFVLVTDEVENTPFRGHYFAELFAKYRRDVNADAILVVVCVGVGDARFRGTLADRDIDYRLVCIDGSRPDLAKFDALLGQLAMLSSPGTIAGGSEMAEDSESAKMEEDSENGNDGFVVV